jgi:hypothetical protein
VVEWILVMVMEVEVAFRLNFHIVFSFFATLKLIFLVKI